MNWYLEVLKKYAVFSGRARRQEYWMFILFNLIFTFVAMFLDYILGTAFGSGTYGVIYLLYVLAVFIPSLAVSVRRLHDVGKSGWFYFIVLIPFIGAIWLLVLACTEGQHGPNQYGDDPKGFETLQTDFA